jgi:heme A synthase
MDFVFTLHSHFRWVVVIVAVVAALLNLTAWLRRDQRGLDRKAMAAFLGVVDLQMLLGIVLLFGLGFGGRNRMEHVATMIIAVIVGHLSALWKRRESPVRARNNFFVILVVLALIWVGVSRVADWF